MILRLKLNVHGWLTDKTIDYTVNVSDKYRWKLVLSNFWTEQRSFYINEQIKVSFSLNLWAPVTFPREVPPARWVRI